MCVWCVCACVMCMCVWCVLCGVCVLCVCVMFVCVCYVCVSGCVCCKCVCGVCVCYLCVLSVCGVCVQVAWLDRRVSGVRQPTLRVGTGWGRHGLTRWWQLKQQLWTTLAMMTQLKMMNGWERGDSIFLFEKGDSISCWQHGQVCFTFVF